MKKSVLTYYLKYTVPALLLLLLIVLYVLEFPYFSNTIQVKQLVMIALIVGATLGTFIAFQFKHKAKDDIERFQIFAFCIVLSIIFMPLFASLSNRLLSFRPLQQEQVELFKVEPFLSERFGVLKDETVEPEGYRVFFIRNGNLERIITPQELFKEKKKGDFIQISIKKGLWGYELISL